MRHTFLLMGLVISISSLSRSLSIVPLPAEFNVTHNEIQVKVPLDYCYEDVDNPFVESRIKALNERLKYNTQPGAILAFYVDSELPEEGYRIVSAPDTIRISASNDKGFRYSLVTLGQLMHGKASLPEGTILDYPKYAYRGLMFDVSRHFFTANDIKRILDVMAQCKLNRFQWHLTDDHGWRLPVDKYPDLCTVGATHPAGSRLTDLRAGKEWRSDTPDGPFAYTPDEIHDIVAYADSLAIEIIPEVEMPGHMAAAIAAYPWLSCRPDSIDGVRALEGISTDVLNVASPKARQFVFDVIDALADYFPSPMIHIGGDEAPTIEWERNTDCSRLADSLNLQGENESKRMRKLQNWFTRQVADYAAAKGKRLMSWDEIITAPGADLDVAMSINPLVMAYDIVYDNPVEQCDSLGLECIYAPFGPYYINRRYSWDKIGAGRGKDDPQQVFAHKIPESAAIKGVSAVFWTEWVTTMSDFEYLAFPRLQIVAERAWNGNKTMDFDDFLKRMRSFSPGGLWRGN